MSISLTRLQTFHGHLQGQELLAAMWHEFGKKMALSTSFGADSAVLLALAAKVDKTIPVLFLDTQKHFPETLTYAQKLITQLGLTNVQYLHPHAPTEQQIDADGTLWRTQPNRCCWLRKVAPFDKALKDGDFQAVITGRKRYQTAERATMPSLEQDEHGRIKINPLAFWSKDDLEQFIADEQLPPHPLIAQGYASIGCQPCTRPVKAGEDERAGRWAHTQSVAEDQKTECGLHVALETTTPDWSV